MVETRVPGEPWWKAVNIADLSVEELDSLTEVYGAEEVGKALRESKKASYEPEKDEKLQQKDAVKPHEVEEEEVEEVQRHKGVVIEGKNPHPGPTLWWRRRAARKDHFPWLQAPEQQPFSSWKGQKRQASWHGKGWKRGSSWGGWKDKSWKKEKTWNEGWHEKKAWQDKWNED